MSAVKRSSILIQIIFEKKNRKWRRYLVNHFVNEFESLVSSFPPVKHIIVIASAWKTEGPGSNPGRV
jgi:hypothetical protein